MAEMKEVLKSPIKIELSAQVTVEELFNLMQQNAGMFPAAFKLKKGLMGTKIEFDTIQQIMPVISVKGNTVKIERITNKTEVKVLGIGGDIKAMKQNMAAFKEGGLKAAVMGGNEYFYNTRVALEGLLAGK